VEAQVVMPSTGAHHTLMFRNATFYKEVLSDDRIDAYYYGNKVAELGEYRNHRFMQRYAETVARRHTTGEKHRNQRVIFDPLSGA